MIRVAVIDDEPLARTGVTTRLARHEGFELVGEYGDGPAALAGILALAPDVVFIDVQMPGMSGIDVLAALPAATRPLAILLTAYENFAIRAFELQAIDYLLKPVDDERFVEALERARKAHAHRRQDKIGLAETPAREISPAPTYLDRFKVRLGRRTTIVHAADVEWIEADGDYATLHGQGRSYLLRESLSRLSGQLDPLHFLRVHRSTIVRIDRVAEWQSLPNRDALLRLHDGTLVRASRTYVGALLDRLLGA